MGTIWKTFGFLEIFETDRARQFVQQCIVELNREDDIENIFLSFSLINGHEIAPFSPPFKSKYTNKILTEVSSSNEPCNLRNFAFKCQKNIRYWLSAGVRH